MLLLTFVVLAGTLFPFFSGLLSDHPITLKSEYFTKITAPGGLLLLLLLGVCPHLIHHGLGKSWRIVGAVLAGVAAVLIWGLASNLAVAYLVVCAFVGLNLAADFVQRYIRRRASAGVRSLSGTLFDGMGRGLCTSACCWLSWESPAPADLMSRNRSLSGRANGPRSASSSLRMMIWMPARPELHRRDGRCVGVQGRQADRPAFAGRRLLWAIGQAHERSGHPADPGERSLRGLDGSRQRHEVDQPDDLHQAADQLDLDRQRPDGAGSGARACGCCRSRAGRCSRRTWSKHDVPEVDSVARMRGPRALAAAGQTRRGKATEMGSHREIPLDHNGSDGPAYPGAGQCCGGVAAGQGHGGGHERHRRMERPSKGDEVTLLLYKGQEQIDSLSAKVGQDGKAVFENVPAGPDMAAVARAKHQNMAFHSQPVLLGSASGEVIGERAGVRCLHRHLEAVRRHASHHGRGALDVAGIHGVHATEQPFRYGDHRLAKRRPEPARRDRGPPAEGLQGPDGVRLSRTGGAGRHRRTGSTTRWPCRPGEHQVTFSYKVDIGRGPMNIAKEITLPTSELMIFWEHGTGPAGRAGRAHRPAHQRRGSAGGVLSAGPTSSRAIRLPFRSPGSTRRNRTHYTWIVLAAVFAAIVIIALLRLRPTINESRSDGMRETTAKDGLTGMALSVHGVSKTFVTRPVLRGIDLAVPDGPGGLPVRDQRRRQEHVAADRRGTASSRSAAP